MTPLRAPGPPGSPTRVGDLLLPTILTLAGRNTTSVEQFLGLFPPHGSPPLTPSQRKAANP
jgi:hypothetical protein